MTNLPNILTLARIAAIPVIVATFYMSGDAARWVAFVVFVAASLTDLLDGYLARRLNSVSAIGRFLDPIADKLLVAAILLMLAAFGGISDIGLIAALIILLREVLVAGLREHLAELHVGVPVSSLAKWKTAVQMVALTLLLVAGVMPASLRVQSIGEICLWIAALLTAITGWDYLRVGIRHMRGAAT
jgi:cardiolipin synthase